MILFRSGEITLNECLENFTKEEVMDGDEMPVKKNINFWKYNYYFQCILLLMFALNIKLIYAWLSYILFPHEMHSTFVVCS